MGRRADAPSVQEAKGNAGRRGKKALADREAKLKAAADALAAAPVLPEGVPESLAGNDRAIAVFQRLAPHLRSTHRLRDEDMPAFTIFCTLFAEWEEMQTQVRENGLWQYKPHHSNPEMMIAVPHPAKRARDDAMKALQGYFSAFGLTPADRFALFKNQQMAALLNPDLFGDGTAKPGSAAQPTAPAEEPSLIGAMQKLDSVPPGTSVQ